MKPAPVATIETELSATYHHFNELHAEALAPRTSPARLEEVLDHMESITTAARARWGHDR